MVKKTDVIDAIEAPKVKGVRRIEAIPNVKVDDLHICHFEAEVVIAVDWHTCHNQTKSGQFFQFC